MIDRKDIAQWAEEIKEELSYHQSEPHYEFESCFNTWTANVVWSYDYTIDKGDYWTAPACEIFNEKVNITVTDEDSIVHSDIAEALLGFIY